MLGVFLISGRFWVSGGFISYAFSYPMGLMFEQRGRTFGIHLKGFTSIISALFLVILSSNLLGLLPYGFGYSRHIVFSLCFGLPMWFSLILSRAHNRPYIFFAGLLPGGAPN